MLIAISDVMLVSIAALWLVAACISDLKKREIPNWLSFSLIAIALAIRGMTALLSQQAFYFFNALIALAAFFVIANVLYYGKIFGGGDAKLLLALSVVFATAPFFAKTSLTLPALPEEPFMLSFFVNIIVLGFIYGIVFALYSAIKHKKAFFVQFKKIRSKTKAITVAFLIAAIAFLTISFFILKALFLLLFIIFLIAPFLYIFIKAVENSALIKKLKPHQLSEGDWLVEEIKIGHKLIKPSVHGLSAYDIKLLKKAKKKVLIKIGLPFVPIFVIALICTLLFGDLLMAIVLSFV